MKDNKEENKQITKDKTLKYYIIELLEVILYPAILYMILESIKFNNIPNYFSVFKNVIFNAPQYIIVAYIIYLSVILFFKGIIKNSFIANCISTTLLTIITIISYYKYNVLQQPFIPYDVFLAKNLNQITQFGVNGIHTIIIFSIINIIFLISLDYFINKLIKNNLKNHIYLNTKQLICLVLSIILTIVFCISPNRYIKNGIKNDNGDNYNWMGANAVFFMHLGDFFPDKPKEYNKNNLLKIKSEYCNNANQNKDEETNVILIMNESFADLSNMSNVSYSESPLKVIEGLKSEEKCITGEILSPVLGGGTSLPEFEVLTGLSSYFLPQQIYPYTSYINSNMNSIVREFNNNNYTTIGIHTNTKTFYNRFNIYKYLGFESTVFKENMINPEYKGNYISDNEAANQIIKQFETYKGKKFIFTVTMQNHMKYTDKNYEQYDIDIESKVLSSREKLELKNYSQGVTDACEMYYKLLQYLKEKKEPTVLIMFGDHLPLLGDTYCSTYKKTNFNALDYYKTPYIIWANYDIDKTIDIPKIISPSNLGIYTLKFANIENISWFIKPFEELYKKYPAINNKYAINQLGNVVDIKTLDKEQIIQKCRVVQYDLLIKKKFIPVN